MKKIFISSSIVLTAVLCLAAPVRAGESAIVKYDSSEVKLKSAVDCKNEFKSTFIKKIETLSKGQGMSAKRFERLKNEIKKLRERTLARIEKINASVEKFNAEKKDLSCLLKELDSAEVGFNKIKILPDENTAETSVKKSKD